MKTRYHQIRAGLNFADKRCVRFLAITGPSSIAEIAAGTGESAHTLRFRLDGLKQRGRVVERVAGFYDANLVG